MRKIYLFDWGDTLMKDDTSQSLPMKDWPSVQAVEGAKEVLSKLSVSTVIYVATGSTKATPEDMKAAFERVDLAQYIRGYFCPQLTGYSKDSPEYYRAIAKTLEVDCQQLMMIGDNYQKDILPSRSAGLEAVWFNDQGLPKKPGKMVTALTQLI
ncbi:hypothetical protein VST7929_01249 [Vibrio stylophorae]|uniref:Hydrolase n=1 Tax=Vibrio stylophorae TaxID=659351 RepID=A0ABN8DU77_9VIBR|nr:HAD family hydrolase [Vibrio stylophorae]CAH0533383.1 hypothetical protein VST7929_01249 [Vibrio stylophorae]